MFPIVEEYGNINQESFESYYNKWPNILNNIPKCVVENWVYRHWGDFQDWISLEPQHWSFELKEFSNDEILSISHIYDWIENLHNEGIEYVNNTRRSESWLGQYMLRNGTTPTPIIVGINFGRYSHPKAPQICYMKEPFQLIEGHSRLGCLFGMIDSSHQNLKSKHKVWVAKST
jgi:hypothetical protein